MNFSTFKRFIHNLSMDGNSLRRLSTLIKKARNCNRNVKFRTEFICKLVLRPKLKPSKGLKRPVSLFII